MRLVDESVSEGKTSRGASRSYRVTLLPVSIRKPTNQRINLTSLLHVVHSNNRSIHTRSIQTDVSDKKAFFLSIIASKLPALATKSTCFDHKKGFGTFQIRESPQSFFSPKRISVFSP